MSGLNKRHSAFVITAIWIRPFSSLLSLVSSAAIIYMILSNYQQKLREQPNNRFILMMSIMDVLQSLALMSSSFALPPSSGQYAARGNAITCSIQGFLIQVGIAVPCYNACLCIWFLQNIKHNMQPRIFARKVEPYCHAVAMGVPWIRSIVYISLHEYVPRGYVCAGVKSATFLVMSFTGIVLSLCFLIMVYCLAAIYCSFNEKEKQMRRYSTSSSGMQWRKSTFLVGKRHAAKQGLLYSSAFLITFIFPILSIFITHEGATNVLSVFTAIFYPLQGFWNFLFYNRRALKRIGDEYPELSFLTSIWKLVFHPDQVKPKTRRGRRGRRGSARRSSIDAGGLRNTVMTRGQSNTPRAFRKKKNQHEEKEEETEEEIKKELFNCNHTTVNRHVKVGQGIGMETGVVIGGNSKLRQDSDSYGIEGDIEKALMEMEAEGLVVHDDDYGGGGGGNESVNDHHNEDIYSIRENQHGDSGRVAISDSKLLDIVSE